MSLTSQQQFIIKERSLADFMSSRPAFGIPSSNIVPLPSAAPLAGVIENRPALIPNVEESFVGATICTPDLGRIPLVDARQNFGWDAGTRLSIVFDGDRLTVSVTTDSAFAHLDQSGRLLLPKWARELIGIDGRVFVLSSYVSGAPVVTISTVSSVASTLLRNRERNI
jgi:bifunctional DNA-binding transcriptional regulator/antitoxin component of YhaV-PrlF toxin-antitoxin module